MGNGGAHSTHPRSGASQTRGAGTGGSGTGGGTTNERLARLEENMKHTATKTDVERLRTDVTKSIGDLRTEMTKSVGKLREETQASILKVTKSIGDLKTEMKASNNTQLKWLIATMIAMHILLASWMAL